MKCYPKKYYAKKYYVGKDSKFLGKGALVQKVRKGFVKVQFDDMTLPEAFGWHLFPSKDFRRLT
jgi:hypothetical protein